MRPKTGMREKFFKKEYSATRAAMIQNRSIGNLSRVNVSSKCPGAYSRAVSYTHLDVYKRQLRMGLKQPQLIDRLTSFSLGNHRISNFEMETSAIYGMGKVLGHSCLSLSAIVANRISKTFSKDGGAAVENLIVKTLGIISGI